MDAINGRWRKPKGRPTNKKLAARKRANERWSSLQNKPEEDSNVISETFNSSSNRDMSLNDSAVIVPATASEKKLSEVLQVSSKCVSSEVGDVKNVSYVLMQSKTWASFLCNVKCDNCETNSLDVDTERMYGYSTKLKLFCKSCGKIFSSNFSSTRGNESNCFDINKKLVEAFLKIGKGHAALEIFSMVVGLHAMDKKTFSHCLHELSEEKEKLKDDVLEFSRNIVYRNHEELGSNENVIDVAVSYDGTWHKRGHTSLYGIGFAIDILTGLVIDFEILSKYCSECICSKRDLGSDSAEFYVWFEGHKKQCSQNFYGSSNAMEMTAAEVIWKRSAQNRIHYTTILSDGDAKTFHHLQGLNVYGDDVTLTKEECINHVAKRLGVGLRNKVKEWRAKGVCIGGRKEGNLKEETIVKLTNFYRKAIRENVNDVNGMKTAIYATLLHCSSTDLSPKHSKCPTGPESWCFFQRAQYKNEKPKSHSTMKTKLSEGIVSKILPVYQRLASTELLSRCAKGKTQNANESAVTLKLVSLEVPDKVARGQGTRLTCGYDLEGDILYSIKWYRDDVEFFRYVPTDKPPGQFFPLQGIKVDLDKSANGSVYIRDISHLTAGIYKCEVSADAPSFQTVSAEKPMAVQESSGQAQYEADRSTVNMLLVTMLLILQWRYHVW